MQSFFNNTELLSVPPLEHKLFKTHLVHAKNSQYKLTKCIQNENNGAECKRQSN